MKKVFLLMILFVSFSTEAVCFKSYALTGIGKTTEEAESDLISKANATCGDDEFSWASRISGVSFILIGTEGEPKVQASARYQCCTQW